MPVVSFDAMSSPIIALVLALVQSPPHKTGLPAPLAGVVQCEMAGHVLTSAPGFTFDRTFIEGGPMKISVDPVEHPLIQGANGYLFVVTHKSLDMWLDDPTLVDVRGLAQSVWFPGTDLAGNATDVMFGPISGDVGDSFGKPYDLVLDMNWNAVLDAGETELLGCVYVDPPEPGAAAGSDALVSWWVVDRCAGSDLERALADAVPRWLTETWGFRAVHYTP